MPAFAEDSLPRLAPDEHVQQQLAVKRGSRVAQNGTRGSSICRYCMELTQAAPVLRFNDLNQVRVVGSAKLFGFVSFLDFVCGTLVRPTLTESSTARILTL